MKGAKLMAVIGAILGDIAGSQFEFNRPENLDYKHCELFTNRCSYTDDTIMTLAVKKAILAVVNGEDYIQPSLIPVLNSKMLDRDSDSSKIESLTRRELEVLKMLSYGTYNKEIAEHLNISERTVKNHVSNIFKKIGVTDRTQAAVFAIRNNLITI